MTHEAIQELKDGHPRVLRVQFVFVFLFVKRLSQTKLESQFLREGRKEGEREWKRRREGGKKKKGEMGEGKVKMERKGKTEEKREKS